LASGPGNPNNTLAAPPAPAQGKTAPDNYKRYRVAANGESILEVARKTLGNARDWDRIYQLNPTIRPEFPIPGGTELKLPPAATIP